VAWNDTLRSTLSSADAWDVLVDVLGPPFSTMSQAARSIELGAGPPI
jgi:hypothetical protein